LLFFHSLLFVFEGQLIPSHYPAKHKRALLESNPPGIRWMPDEKVNMGSPTGVPFSCLLEGVMPLKTHL
jgi:hypothetical protein